jgi:predicted transposase/invertase (TIGR01784 family)
MQNHGHYIKRSLYYWSKVYHSQLKQGENYDTLKKTIAIHVLNFSLFKHSKHYHTEAVVMDVENKVQLTDMFSIHYLDLAKLPSGNYNTLEKWLRFLKQPSKVEVLQMNIPAMTKAYKQLENMSLDSGIRARYDAKRKFEHDYVTGLDTAREEGVKRVIKKEV